MTEVEVSRLLSKLEKSADRLNAASDSINTILENVEERLADLKVGLEAWLDDHPITTGAEEVRDAGRQWVERRLGYAKVDGAGPAGRAEWKLAVKKVRMVSGFVDGNPDE